MTSAQIKKIFSTDLNYSANTLIQPNEVNMIALDNDSSILICPQVKIKFVNSWNIMEVYKIKDDGTFDETKPESYIPVSIIFYVSLKY